jgi:hypothetical protein
MRYIDPRRRQEILHQLSLLDPVTYGKAVAAVHPHESWPRSLRPQRQREQRATLRLSCVKALLVVSITERPFSVLAQTWDADYSSGVGAQYRGKGTPPQDLQPFQVRASGRKTTLEKAPYIYPEKDRLRSQIL